jgi:hypothetical protein
MLDFMPPFSMLFHDAFADIIIITIISPFHFISDTLTLSCIEALRRLLPPGWLSPIRCRQIRHFRHCQPLSRHFRLIRCYFTPAATRVRACAQQRCAGAERR